MKEAMRRDYESPVIEVLTLAVEPLMLNEGLMVGDEGDHEIMPLATSGTWTPWV